MKLRSTHIALCAAGLSTFSILYALDQNNDQISDVYAQHYGLAAGSGGENPDGDAHSNYIESIWGTDPFDSESVFKPTYVSSSGVFDFAISTVAGKRYQFQGQSNLNTAGWMDIDEPFTGTGAVEHLLTMIPISGADKFFWRVEAVSSLDEDSDGLDSFEELLLGTSDTATDSDGDSIDDLDEFLAGLNPALNLDADGDGLPDDWERFHLGTTGFTSAFDNDGDLYDLGAEFAFGLNPLLREAETAPGITVLPDGIL